MSRILKMRNNGRKRGGNECVNIPMARDELDCMPSAILKLEEQQRQNQENGNIQHNQQWQRRLSPLKRRPSFFGGAGTSSSSVSPQRGLSPERKWLPQLLLPLLSKTSTTNGNEKMDGNGTNSLQEAWESLKNGNTIMDRNCDDDNIEKQKTQKQSNKYKNEELMDMRLSASLSPQKNNNKNNSKYISSQNTFQSPITSINCELPPKSTTSNKNLKTSEMLRNNNGFIQNGQNIPKKPLPKPRQKQEEKNIQEKQQKDDKNIKTTEQQVDDEEAMSTSILASASWYRDSKGRTGYRPQSEQTSGSRIQNSPVKMLSNKTQSLIDAHSVLDIKSKNHAFSNNKNFNNLLPQLLRHTTTHPNTSFGDQIFLNNLSCNIRGEHSSPPRMLRRTNKSKELIKEEENDFSNYFNLFKEEKLKKNNFLNNSPIEEMERLVEQLSHSKSGYQQQQQPQKMVKFAETVQINEIEKFEGSSTSSNNSCASSSSTLSNHSFDNIEDIVNEESSPKIEENNLIKNKKEEKREKMLINGVNGRQKKERQSSTSITDSSTDVGQVIEQFFNQCNSMSIKSDSELKIKEENLYNNEDKNVKNSHLLITPPIEQRSFYDNLNEEEEESDEKLDKKLKINYQIKKGEKEAASWLHTKAKVIAQQNCGPIEWRRDGSPRRRVQMLITSDNARQENFYSVPINSINQRIQETKMIPSSTVIPSTKSSMTTSTTINNFNIQPNLNFINNNNIKHLPRQHNQIKEENERRKNIKKYPPFIITSKNTQNNWPSNF